MTNVCIIQARMTSKRFPGKSMALLGGSPVLAHVIERCKMIPFVQKVVVAMPADKSSDPLDKLCSQLEVDPFFGPEEDVLRRYYLAASLYDASVVIRITGDCPFIDPVVCGEVLALLKAKELDYCSNIHPIRTYPRGLDCEVFTFDCLEASHIRSRAAYDREHVTPWMKRIKQINRMCVRQKIDVSSQNWCVDWPGDIQRLEALLIEAQKRYESAHPLPGVGRAFTTDELLQMEAQRGSPN